MSEKKEQKQDTPVFRSFAEAVNTLSELMKIETAIESALSESHVPHHETRKMLRAMNTMEASATPLCQYISILFEKVGLGKIEITKKEIFRIEFSVSKPCPICKLYKDAHSKSCYITAETLSKFFTNDLEIPSTAKETACINEGKERCTFLVEMQPLAVYQIALDAVDDDIIEYIFKKKGTSGNANKLITCTQISKDLGVDADEVKYHCEILENFKIIDSNLNLTEIGLAYRKHTGKVQKEEKVFPPPWQHLEKITESIASAESFAEAMSRSIKSEEEVVINEKDIINLAEEAKKSKSFAELLFKTLKQEEDKND